MSLVDYTASDVVKKERKATRVAALEDAQQAIRYALKYQNHPSNWDDMTEEQKGWSVAHDVMIAAIQDLIERALDT